ncbi:MAG: DNA cytosine methyltransferase [Prevotella sp.]|nr:DNA cytosine methyltransferase [Prevotella sp.]
MTDRIIKAIDLFAGAGGLSFGFETKGIEVALAIEKDSWAAETYQKNHKNKNCIEADITKLTDSFFGEYQGKADIVMGGPPCQGFSIAASNRRKEGDERNFLYKEFLRVVSVVKPRVVLLENVKEFGKYYLPDGRLLVDDIVTTLDNYGYRCSYSVIDVKDYGIPQDRRRFFLIGVKDKTQEIDIMTMLKAYNSKACNLGEAISDLPVVMPYQFKEGDVMPYTQEPQNDFQHLMRDGAVIVSNHIPMQHTPKTVEKFRFLLNNGNKDELPDNLRSVVRGDTTRISNSKFSQNHRVMDAYKIAPTITASFYSSFIHPNQPRNLTVREAARIQTFPDTFIFYGKRTTLSKKLLSRKGIVEDLHLDQFNQVGNAVPPMMASIMADICIKLLEGMK